MIKSEHYALQVLVDLANDGMVIRETAEEWEEFLRAPDWDDKCRIHNWKNYVDERVKGVWDKLSLEARLIVFAGADRQAGEEVWD